MSKQTITILIAVVGLVLMYFIFFKKSGSESSFLNDGTCNCPPKGERCKCSKEKCDECNKVRQVIDTTKF